MVLKRLGFPLLVIAGASAVQSGRVGAEDYQGSLYPADLSVSLTGAAPAPETKNATPAKTSDTALAKALGSAAYILSADRRAETFDAEIRSAIARHPAFHGQTSVLDESRAERRRARAGLYPQLSTSFRGDYSLAREFGADTDNAVEALRPREQFTAGLSASQLVFDGGATVQRIKSAKARYTEFENALSTRINDLALNAISAHVDLATHQALTVLGEAIVERHVQILGDVKERKRLGAGSQADVDRAAARLATAEARVAGIRESKRIAEIRYLEFFDGVPGVLARPMMTDVAVNDREAAMDAAIAANPEIAAAAARADASRAEYKASRAARLPEVRVSVDAVKYDLFEGTDDFDVRAGVNLNYDLYGGGARAADIASAKARARRERFSEEQVRLEITRDAAMAFEQKRGAEARLAALRSSVIAHDKTRNAVLERYRVSRGDLIDVLQAENDYFEAAVEYLTGLAADDMAAFALMEHTGALLQRFSPAIDYENAVSGDLDG